MKNFHPILRLLVHKDTISMRNAAFLMRRPHRSFKRTYRRDYVRSLKLPGYFRFTGQVWRMLWSHKSTFLLLALLYAVASLLFGGITNQQSYQEIAGLVNQSAGNILQGAWGSVGKAGILLFAAFISPQSLTAQQQIYLAAFAVMIWLATVWLLREMMAGRRPKMRDGLYSSGAPIVASFGVLLVALAQLFPIALISLVYSALTQVGLLVEGLSTALFTTFSMLVGTLVLYWITPTFLALVIVTLPGMYPMRALRAAGDIVVGRRLRILYRILWMVVMLALGWVVVMILTVLLDSAIKNLWPALNWLPLVPMVAAFMGSLSAVWASAYIYMLYRRILDDDASPA